MEDIEENIKTPKMKRKLLEERIILAEQ
jgi:hypothetical protein